jgi:uncharacterized membrane protein YoaK (UPF0700 family)
MRYHGTLLAFIAGAVDTFSFLALSGLFAAHVTGNFVLLGATLVLGRPAGVWSKVLAVPLFAVGVWVASIGGAALQRRHRRLLPWLLGAEFVLLLAALGVAMAYGPFANADSPIALLLGSLLILAMGTQAALGPLAAPQEPPTTVMTTTLTRLVIDLSILTSRAFPSEADRERTRLAAVRLAEQCAAFLVGCAVSAGGHVLIGPWSLALPTCAVAVLLAVSTWRDPNAGDR